MGQSLIKKVDNLYSDQIKDFRLVYNLLNMKGLVLLNPEISTFFNFCDGTKSAEEIGTGLGWPTERAIGVAETLWRAGIVSLGGKMAAITEFKKNPQLDVWFHLSNDCNLDCGYCYIHKTHSNMSLDVAKKAIHALIASTVRHGWKEIMIKFAGGEPLLVFPLMKQVIDYGRTESEKAGIFIKFMLVTNGTIITSEVANYLKNEKMKVAISMDGLGKYNDLQRKTETGIGSFSKIEHGIFQLQEKDVKPQILTTVAPSNLEGLPELTQFLLKKGLGFRFNLYKGAEKNPSELKDFIKQAIKILGICYSLFEEQLPDEPVNEIHQFCDSRFTSKKKRNCGIAINGVTVGHDGRIALCQSLLDNPIGNIYENEIISTIQSQKQLPMKEYNVDSYEKCKNCQWRYICGGGCPLLTRQIFGRFDTKSPYCEVHKSVFPKIIKIMGRQALKKVAPRKEGKNEND